MGKPKVGMSIYSYGADLRRRRMTVEQAIDHAASLGVEGIELVSKQHVPNYMHPRIYDLQRLRDHIESYGMKMSCFSTYIDTRPRRDRPTTLEEMIFEAHDHVAQAAVLGARVVRPTVFGVWTQHSGKAEKKSVEAFHRKLIKITEEALPDLKKHNVMWGNEIHAPMAPDFMLPPVKKINDKSVGLVPDFSVWQTSQVQQVHVVGKYPPESLKPLLPYTVHIHAKAHSFNAKGEELNTPYEKLLSIIKESGYGGYISAEFEGWWDGTDFDSKKIAKTHVELIKRYL